MDPKEQSDQGSVFVSIIKSSHTFYMIFCPPIFFKINFFENFFQELYPQSVKYLLVRPNILLGLIRVKTVCKGYQLTTHTCIVKKVISLFGFLWVIS